MSRVFFTLVLVLWGLNTFAGSFGYEGGEFGQETIPVKLDHSLTYEQIDRAFVRCAVSGSPYTKVKPIFQTIHELISKTSTPLKKVWAFVYDNEGQGHYEAVDPDLGFVNVTGQNRTGGKTKLCFANAPYFSKKDTDTIHFHNPGKSTNMGCGDVLLFDKENLGTTLEFDKNVSITADEVRDIQYDEWGTVSSDKSVYKNITINVVDSAAIINVTDRGNPRVIVEKFPLRDYSNCLQLEIQNAK